MRTRRRSAYPLLALLGFLVACTTFKPSFQVASDPKASFENIRTFAWLEGIPMPHGFSIVDGRFIDDRVRRAVDADLANKGLRPAAGGPPDIYVAYSTDLGGLAQDQEHGGEIWWGSVYTTAPGEETMAIALDIRNPAKKLIWRGAVVRALGSNPEAVGHDLDRAVGDMLAKFPPAPGSTK